MTFNSAVRFVGVCVAALTVGLTSACGASSEEESQKAVKSQVVSTTPPSSGLGEERMDPTSDVYISGLDLFLAGPRGSEMNFSDGLGMFGEGCLLSVKHNIGTETYQVSLVLNDDSDSLEVVQDATSRQDVDELLSRHTTACA